MILFLFKSKSRKEFYIINTIGQIYIVVVAESSSNGLNHSS